MAFADVDDEVQRLLVVNFVGQELFEVSLGSKRAYFNYALRIEPHNRGRLLAQRQAEEGGGVLDARQEVFQLESEVPIQELSKEVVVGEIFIQKVQRRGRKRLSDLFEVELTVVFAEDDVHESGHEGPELVLEGLDVQKRAVEQLHELAVSRKTRLPVVRVFLQLPEHDLLLAVVHNQRMHLAFGAVLDEVVPLACVPIGPQVKSWRRGSPFQGLVNSLYFQHGQFHLLYGLNREDVRCRNSKIG